MALALGGLVGLERELTYHPAGIRTHILVTVGACAFTAMSLYGFPGFPGGDRVAAAVVTGIGFIGGGAILRSKEGWVVGLTTAASLWSCAAIGMLAGTGYYLVAAVVTVIDLLVLEFIDWWIDRVSPRFKTRTLPVTVGGSHRPDGLDSVMAVLDAEGCCPEIINYHRKNGGAEFDASLITKVKSKADLEALTDSLYGVDGVRDVFWG